MYYQIANIKINSQIKLPSFENFIYKPANDSDASDIELILSDETEPEGEEVTSGYIAQRKTENGWYFHHIAMVYPGLLISSDYTKLQLVKHLDQNAELTATFIEESMVRMAIECMLARRGCVSLHSACIELDGEAIAFSGPSGTGKSTRANAWMEAFPDAKLVSGDRPLIDVRNLQVYGVPWDGKEKCYRNVHYPIKAIFEVRRSDSTYIREMSYEQRRKLLMRQCFLPMWDTETAVIQMINIAKLAANAPILRIFCGPAATDAEALRSIYNSHNFREERTDMKAKSGFVLRNIAGEQILMPTGDNIGKFKGTVLLNDVSAFVWEKLQNPMSKEDLLQAIVDNYEVEEAVAAKDLDDLLATLDGFGVIEND